MIFPDRSFSWRKGKWCNSITAPQLWAEIFTADVLCLLKGKVFKAQKPYYMAPWRGKSARGHCSHRWREWEGAESIPSRKSGYLPPPTCPAFEGEADICENDSNKWRDCPRLTSTTLLSVSFSCRVYSCSPNCNFNSLRRCIWRTEKWAFVRRMIRLSKVDFYPW